MQLIVLGVYHVSYKFLLLKWSGFRMVGLQLQPKPDHLKSDLQKVRISSGRISDPPLYLPSCDWPLKFTNCITRFCCSKAERQTTTPLLTPALAVVTSPLLQLSMKNHSNFGHLNPCTQMYSTKLISVIVSNAFL